MAGRGRDLITPAWVTDKQHQPSTLPPPASQPPSSSYPMMQQQQPRQLPYNPPSMMPMGAGPVNPMPPMMPHMPGPPPSSVAVAPPPYGMMPRQSYGYTQPGLPPQPVPAPGIGGARGLQDYQPPSYSQPSTQTQFVSGKMTRPSQQQQPLVGATSSSQAFAAPRLSTQVIDPSRPVGDASAKPIEKSTEPGLKDKEKAKKKAKMSELEIKKELQKKEMKLQAEKKKRRNFICDIKYRNTLPDLSFEPKYLRYPLSDDWLYRYKVSTFEKTYKRRIHLDPRLASDCDILSMSIVQKRAESVPLPEGDMNIIRKDDKDPLSLFEIAVEGKHKQREHGVQSDHAVKDETVAALDINAPLNKKPRVNIAGQFVKEAELKTHLLKPIYVENKPHEVPNQLSKVEIDEQIRLKKLKRLESKLDVDTDERDLSTFVVERIKKMFTVAHERCERADLLKHPTNPNLKPKRIMSIVPNFSLAKNEYHLVQINDDALGPDEGAFVALSKRKKQAVLDHAILTALSVDSSVSDPMFSYLIPVVNPPKPGEEPTSPLAKEQASSLSQTSLSQNKNSSSSSSQDEDDDDEDLFKVDDDDEDEQSNNKSSNIETALTQKTGDDDDGNRDKSSKMDVESSQRTSAMESKEEKLDESFYDAGKLQHVRDYQCKIFPETAQRFLFILPERKSDDQQEDDDEEGNPKLEYAKFSLINSNFLTLERKKVRTDDEDTNPLWIIDRRHFTEKEEDDRKKKIIETFGEVAEQLIES